MNRIGLIDENRIVEDCNQHNISVVGNNGGNRIIPSVSSAMLGNEVTYSVEIQPDYMLNSVEVYKSDDETFKIPVVDNKFAMPNFDVTVKADFEYLNIGEGHPEWYYEIQNLNGSITYQHLEQAADTTVNDKTVTIIIRTNTLYDKSEHTDVTREYVYEEDNIVYWWNKDLQEFTVLYDLGAQEGDSWVIKVGTASLTMHVDAVEQYEYEGRVFKMLQVSDVDDLFNGTIVCGIGHLTSFFPERLMTRGKDYRVEGIRCYWREGELVFKYGDRDCNEVYEEWHNGIEEDGSSTGPEILTVYPNPTDGILFVQTLRATSLQTETYRISNLMGQTLMSGTITTGNQRIDVSDLPDGMYFITFAGATRKFVVR
ncbi:MAG: T9SS type A sorting domain-containing protein [Bacteroidales bacterium]|nr:T9SS type A sorting domain-containing protein [Bacteroidales bacterium]